MKKALKITLFSVLGLVVVAGVLVWMEFGSLIKGAMSCEKLDEGMYYMEYAGDDGFVCKAPRGQAATCARGNCLPAPSVSSPCCGRQVRLGNTGMCC